MPKMWRNYEVKSIIINNKSYNLLVHIIKSYGMYYRGYKMIIKLLNKN